MNIPPFNQFERSGRPGEIDPSLVDIAAGRWGEASVAAQVVLEAPGEE